MDLRRGGRRSSSGRLLHGDIVPYAPELREHLVRTLPPARAARTQDVCELDTHIGQAFAQVAADAIAASGPVDLICSHGQTVFHWVDGAHALGTLQLGEPAWIAERTGVPVVSDVRIRDITVGGHGAPLASLMDVLLLGGLPGIAGARSTSAASSNMTVLRAGRTGRPWRSTSVPRTRSSTPRCGSSPMARRATTRDGAWELPGTVDEAALADLLTEPYYALPTPKSTGKELFNEATSRRSGRGMAEARRARTWWRR